MLKDEQRSMLVDIARGAIELEMPAWRDSVRQARDHQVKGGFGSSSVFGFTRAAEVFAPRFVNAAAAAISEHATGLVPAPAGEALRAVLHEVLTPVTTELLKPFMEATEGNNRGMREANLKRLQQVFDTYLRAAEGRIVLRTERVDQAQALLALAAGLLATKDPVGADAARSLSVEIASASPQKTRLTEYLATLTNSLSGIDKGYTVGKMLSDLLGG